MSDLEPEIAQRSLPAEVPALRRTARAEQAAVDAESRESFDAHLTALEKVTATLISTHRAIADHTDLDIDGETRWAVMWQLAGRCIAIARVVIHDLQGGFASEAIGTLRALFEATELLGALAFHEEEEALRRWLGDEWIRPRVARAILARKQELALARMEELGIEPEGGDVSESSYEIYGILSAPAHHRRSGLQESISQPLREFAYGPHPSAQVRATYVEYGGHLIETVLITVGDAFADLIGREYWEQTIRPLQHELETTRRLYPLSDRDV